MLSALVAVFVFLAALLRFGDNGVHMMVPVATGLMGMLLSVAWFLVIRSYRQLHTEKFKALNELESQIAYPFFRREREFLKRREGIKKFWEITVVETFMPWVFFLFFGVFVIVAFVT